MKEKKWQYLEPANIIDNWKLPTSLRKEIGGDEVWRNDLYTVFVRRGVKYTRTQNCLPWINNTVTWLSIKRNDRQPFYDWRHFQWIKNQLVGPENEAIQLFPKESRLVDASNQFHVWVLETKGIEFPFGFENRSLSSKALQGGEQREWPENMIPPDLAAMDKLMNEYVKDINFNYGVDIKSKDDKKP